jgi:hypothetical protein
MSTLKKKLPHGSILHVLYDARQAGRKETSLYELEVHLGISGWDLRAAIEDLKDRGFVTEHENGVIISDAGYSEARTRWP